MPVDIQNNGGGTTGNQRIGGITVKGARIPITTYPVQNNGDYSDSTPIAITSVSGIYQDRFDDVGYYE